MSRRKMAVVYARYSSHRQGEQSIEGQLAEAYKYAEAHDLEIIHEYIDRAMTGRNDNREQFQEMLKDTAKKQFDTIILWKIDRFGRNREEIAFNKYRCKKNGVKVVYVAESIPDSPEGVILESVLEGMAEYYSLQLSQNILRGQRASAEKCQCTGGNRPLGYKTDPVTKKFVIDTETAPTVRLVYDMYAAGNTVSEIVNELNSRGLRTLRGSKFTNNSLRAMLKNEKYIGVYSYKDIVRVEDGVPRIIDDETFYKVQEMLKVNKRAPVRTWNRADYILTDKLFCGHCGSNMIGESGTSKTGAKHNYYVCNKRRREHTCYKKAVRKDWIENIVLDNVVKVLCDEKIINDIADGVLKYHKEIQKENDLAGALQTKLKEVEQAQANLLKAIEAGLFTPTTKKRMEELDAQREEIETELSEIELMRSFELTKEQILYFLRAMRDKNIDDPVCQKQLIDTFVNAVFVYDDKITLTFNYSGDGRTVTLAEIDSAEAEGEVFVCCALCSTKNPVHFGERDFYLLLLTSSLLLQIVLRILENKK